MISWRRRKTLCGKRQDAQCKATQAPPKSIDSTVGVFGYLCLCLNVLFFSFLLAADPSIPQALTREDYWVEHLTAVWFLLAGGLLFATASVEPTGRRYIYILGGVAMAFAAGEEISWGQRIFGFSTPNFMIDLNEQKEFTVHNFANKLFDIIYLNGTLIMCMTTSAAFFCRKNKLWGIPLPSIPLMLGFLIVLSYESGIYIKEFPIGDLRGYLTAIRSSSGLIVFEEKGLLLLFLIFTLLSRQSKLVFASAATLTVILMLTYANYHSDIGMESLFEIREYLFGICCLFYCLELLLVQRRLATKRSEISSGKISFLMMTCCLAIVGSIGLVFFWYFNIMARAAAIEDAYWSITTGEPIIHSYFDIYLIENELIYAKEPCAPADKEALFFLHIIPEDVNDLPDDRRQHGFDNLDFDYDRFSAPVGDKCMAQRPLPDYPVAHIRTGQFTPDDGQIWKAEFPVGAVKSGQGR